MNIKHNSIPLLINEPRIIYFLEHYVRLVTNGETCGPASSLFSKYLVSDWRSTRVALLRTLCLALATANFLVFIIGYAIVFQKKGKPEKQLGLIRLKFPIFSAVTVVAIYQEPNIGFFTGVFGGLLLIFSLVLFILSSYINKNNKLSLAYSKDLPTHVIQRGPYRWIRHPFYTSYITSFVAGLIISGNPYLLIVVGSIFEMYYQAACYEERKFDSSDIAQEYQVYRQNTGMFFPNFIRVFTENRS